MRHIAKTIPGKRRSETMGIVESGPCIIPGLLPPTGETEDAGSEESKEQHRSREYERFTPTKKARGRS
jgi:hypothetical protein